MRQEPSAKRRSKSNPTFHFDTLSSSHEVSLSLESRLAENVIKEVSNFSSIPNMGFNHFCYVVARV